MLVRRIAPRPGRLVPGLLLTALILAAGCAKKPAAVPVTEFQPLADAYFPVKFEHPAGWHVVSEGTRVMVYSTPEALGRFHDPASKGPLGVELVASYEKQTTPEPLAAVVAAFSQEMTTAGFTVSPPTPTTLDGSEAMSVEMTGDVDKKTKLRRTRVFAIRESSVYYVQYSAFNELYDFDAPVKAKLLSTCKLPSPVIVQEGVDPSVPSAETTTFSNSFLSISHPANFEATTPAPKGEMEFSLVLVGYRQDSSLRVDIFPAKALTVEKVFEQNSPMFHGRSNGEATVSGQKAMFVNYTAAAGVSGRAYFLVRNDKVCRIVVTWYQSMKDAYQPAFEKTVQSLQLK